ncbi:PSB6-like protein [Mya arenaria]|uniref:Proteasome subunit beta n=1 Tax=Mya arenaria TaxID=6604 RepID=A0ABY7EYE8_MYAAR|nr:proteasome subunit beta type-6-like [Mya arenaria]XP_052760835.1 proteasome subunit beta type-6-like [Mya arenaria]WAR13861.1 PSB6-like protein [Mya arenaria]
MASMMTSAYLPAISADFANDMSKPDWLTSELSTGTTIAAIEFDGGVVIGADSRTTSGAYIANRVTDKLTKVTDYIYCCRSGSAADTQAVADIVNYHLNFYKMEMGEEPLVRTAASTFRNLCYNNRDGLSAGILVAGWDKRNGGQVYTIPLGGMWTRMPVAIGGSGSTYLYGYVDANYKPGMNKDECLQFIANAISLAINRDGSSGGVIRLACITKDGVERHVLTGDQLPKFYEDS